MPAASRVEIVEPADGATVGSLASIDLNRLTDEQLARISAGEHPMSVLASALGRGLPRGPALGLPAASEEDGEAEEPD